MDDVKMLARIARYGKWIPGIGFAGMAVLGVDEVYDTYEEGGDVWGETGEVITEIISGFAIGAVCSIFFTPVGWIAIAITAVIEGVSISLTSHEFGKIGKYLGDESHEAYNWIKGNLSLWL